MNPELVDQLIERLKPVAPFAERTVVFNRTSPMAVEVRMQAVIDPLDGKQIIIAVLHPMHEPDVVDMLVIAQPQTNVNAYAESDWVHIGRGMIRDVVAVFQRDHACNDPSCPIHHPSATKKSESKVWN